jgi:hypothetical protein
MKMEQTQCSETSAIKHHTPENNPKDYTRHTAHGESLKSRTLIGYGGGKCPIVKVWLLQKSVTKGIENIRLVDL